MASPTLTTGDTQYFWGAQIEAGSVATAYRLTTSTLESVANQNIPGFNAAGYTLFSRCRSEVSATGSVRNSLNLDGLVASNRSTYRVDAAGNNTTIVLVAGVTSASVTEGSSGVTAASVAYSCRANSFLRAVNGVAGTADMSGNLPADLLMLSIGSDISGAGQFNGYIFRAQLIPQALTQAQINGLTT